MNNIITEKHTRRNQQQNNEAEEQINEPEDGMVEITATEQNEEKIMKRNEESQRPLGQYQTHQHLYYRVPRRRQTERT